MYFGQGFIKLIIYIASSRTFLIETVLVLFCFLVVFVAMKNAMAANIVP